MLLGITRAVFGQTCCTRSSLLSDGDNEDTDKPHLLAPLLSSTAGLQLFGLLLLSLRLGLGIF